MGLGHGTSGERSGAGIARPEGRGEANGVNEAATIHAGAGDKDGPPVYATRVDSAGKAHCHRRGGLLLRARPWLSRAVAALLPCACALCGAVQDRPVCAGCERDLLPALPRCRGCALRLPRHGGERDPCQHLCAGCRAAPADFDAAVALGDYVAPADTLVLGLKYGGRLALADWVASRLAASLRQMPERAVCAAPQLVAAVPLGSARLAERGFNQSWEIARRLARRLRLPAHATVLTRARETGSQTALRPACRERNVAGAFAVAPSASIDGAHVLLVDDVMTTGATLSAAALALKRRGAARVTALVALRTPAPWQRLGP